MDDTRRIAMVDTRNDANDNTDQRTVRFQFSNHLGSASLEVDDLGDIISYEEYHPYGTTAYQAVNKDIKAAAKRYRYTGMERDEETGLEYHSARYYLSWLGRWLKPDPEGLVDGENLYKYSRNNPLKFNDPNGTDPPDDDSPITVTPYFTQISPLSLSGNVQFQNLFSENRSASGNLSLSTGLRSSFGLQVPALNLNTTGIAMGTASANADTAAGTSQVQLQGGLVLGNIGSGLNLVTVAEGSFQVPIPNQLVLSQINDTFLNGLPQAQGELSLHGSLRAGAFQLGTFRGGATLNAGQFDAQLRVRSFADIARLDLSASGTIGENGSLSLSTISGTGRVRLPGLLRLDANVNGTSNETGGVDFTGNARLRLFGIPSLSLSGTGSASTEGYNFSGSFSGYVPPLSYVAGGNLTLNSSEGIDVSGSVFGLTYTPGIEIEDPSPLPPAARTILNLPAASNAPSGLTLGYSYTRYGSRRGLTHFSAGAMTNNLKSFGFGVYFRRDF